MPENPPSPLTGHVALVTGAGRRLGAAIARALARRCARVVIHYHHSRREAEALAASIRGAGGQADLLQADLSSPEQVTALLGRCSQVDILVNSASVFPHDRFTDVPAGRGDVHVQGERPWLERAAQVLQVNALAPLLLVRALAARDRPAQAINLLDARIAGYDPLHFTYGLSKQALRTITRQLALELAPKVRVNAVAPGPILPPPGGGQATLTERSRHVPMGRPGSPEDVVRAVLFLAESPYVTGQVIYVDGGAHLTGASAHLKELLKLPERTRG